MTTRNFWPIALFSIPFAAVICGIAMLNIAFHYPDDVVVDEYYKEGMAINERIADTELAVELGIAAQIYLDGPRIRAEISGTEESLHQLNFHHVTDQNRDVAFNLIKQGEYFVALEPNSIAADMGHRGIWYVDLVGVEQGWRLKTRLKTPTTNFSLGVSK